MQRYNGDLLKVNDRVLVLTNDGRSYTEITITNINGNKLQGIQQNDTIELPISHNSRIVYKLAPNETKACALWAGGWDDYIVDINTIRPLNENEIATIARDTGKGLSPKQNGYLLGIFCPLICTNEQAVKIVSHLGGGD